MVQLEVIELEVSPEQLLLKLQSAVVSSATDVDDSLSTEDIIDTDDEDVFDGDVSGSKITSGIDDTRGIDDVCDAGGGVAGILNACGIGDDVCGINGACEAGVPGSKITSGIDGTRGIGDVCDAGGRVAGILNTCGIGDFPFFGQVFGMTQWPAAGVGCLSMEVTFKILRPSITLEAAGAFAAVTSTTSFFFASAIAQSMAPRNFCKD